MAVLILMGVFLETLPVVQQGGKKRERKKRRGKSVDKKRRECKWQTDKHLRINVIKMYYTKNANVSFTPATITFPMTPDIGYKTGQ